MVVKNDFSVFVLCLSELICRVSYTIVANMGFPCSSVGKESTYNAGYLGSIAGLGRAPGEGNDNPLRCSCLGNPMGCSLPASSVHGVAKVRHNLVTKPLPLLPIHTEWFRGLNESSLYVLVVVAVV